MGELGKQQVRWRGLARGLNEVIVVDFIEKKTFEEALVRGKGGSYLDSRQEKHPCKGSRVETCLAW